MKRLIENLSLIVRRLSGDLHEQEDSVVDPDMLFFLDIEISEKLVDSLGRV